MSQNVFFTADEHYGHRNIIDYCKRPYQNVYDMQADLIARHNAKVAPGDLVYHLGDIFWRTISVYEASGILAKLHGNHYLIWGNHDETAESLMKPGSPAFATYGAPKFVWAKDVALIKPRSQYPSIWLSHYAHRTWPKSHKGSWHVYGHTHAVLPDYRRSHDVGVDANDYAPVSLDELAALMNSKVVKPDEVEIDMAKHTWGKDA
jgi:calcineurin-like phosphoesterase family protein